MAMFVDAHNTGYYINSYTTKLNPTMDTVLEKLMAGIRRLQDEQRDADAARLADETPASRRQADFRRTVQTLNRFETCFRRASWKSGAEMVFPILFGHLSFTTHRCWTVFTRAAIFLANEAWRQAYGQLATQPPEDEHSRLTYTLTSGDTAVLHGWREGTRDGQKVYEGPDGREYDSVAFAEEALRQARSGVSGSAAGSAITVLRRLRRELQEGAVEDDDDGAETEQTELHRLHQAWLRKIHGKS